jgi:hypothetical protein
MVDPIELRKKLAKLGIGPKFQFSQAAAMDAARDFLNQHSQEAGVVASDIEVSGSVRGDVDCVCPKCQHEWTMEDVEIEDDAIPVDASEIEDAVEAVADIASIEPGACVLEPAEIAYMIHAWAMLWDLPA